ncbi:MAG: excisionase family DNA-binding protein [Verrucomicrobia bacterium]|nr:excisionase family DNA-binding protein [Verrucomicrobiota bacterium]
MTLLTIPEVADQLRASTRWVYYRIADGTLRAARIAGRLLIESDTVTQYLEQQTWKPEGQAATAPTPDRSNSPPAPASGRQPSNPPPPAYAVLAAISKRAKTQSPGSKPAATTKRAPASA